jgi:hypothetical protein
MFFKNKVNVGVYCDRKVTRLFSQEQEATWDDLRKRCNDTHLNQADRNLYYDNLRAVMLDLMFIPIIKTYSDSNVRGEAHASVDDYLDTRGLTRIASLMGEYNRAFGSSSTDGVEQMVSLFAKNLTQSNMGVPARQLFYTEFCAELRALSKEFESVKLVAA